MNTGPASAGYSLNAAETLSPRDLAAVQGIYEDGFAPHLRADFSSLTGTRTHDEQALALVSDGQPRGFVMLRPLGSTGWMFLRYFVVDQKLRGQGLGGVMWDQLTARLRAEGCTLLVFDVEDPGEPGCNAAERQIRLRRISFYQRHGASLLPVRGYRTPHGDDGEDEWTPMLLLAAPLTAAAPEPGAAAIVSAVCQYRWEVPASHPQLAGLQVAGIQEGS